MSEDTRAYYPFYGISTDDWTTPVFGGTGALHTTLVKHFISEDTSTTSSSIWNSDGITFVYPHNIKKNYYLEGVVEGHITFTNHPLGDKASYVSNYRVSILKLDDVAGETTTVAASNVIDTNDTIGDDSLSDYQVYPFWIDVYSTPVDFNENTRIGIKIEWDIEQSSSPSAYLSHENWQQGEDVKITLPLLL